MIDVLKLIGEGEVLHLSYDEICDLCRRYSLGMKKMETYPKIWLKGSQHDPNEGSLCQYCKFHTRLDSEYHQLLQLSTTYITS